MNLRDQIRKDLVKAANELGLKTDLVEITRPQDPANGDYSTNLALRRFTPQGKPKEGSSLSNHSPIVFAKKLADSLKAQPYLEKLEVAGPGFLNFFIKPGVWQNEVANVLEAGSRYGSNESGKGRRARVEFVSANPTGPLHFGNARGGPIGDSLASVLEFCGYRVLREYYHNDVGVQVEKLGQSILNVSQGKKLEDQEYKGEYILDLAKRIGKVRSTKDAGVKAVKILLDQALADAKAMGIAFNKVYAESDFIKLDKTKAALGFLDKKGVLKKKEGALWFAPRDEFLRDRETVVVKSDGSYTYFANDIAYHYLKFTDPEFGKPDLVIDVLGANHHGHVPRLQAAVESLGFGIDKFHVILYQWVRFRKGQEVLKMAKRAGTFVTAKEVLDEIGRDAVRFFILMHDASSPIDFDLDLAREKSAKNPVYYVQYAHARICSILAKSGARKGKSKANFSLLGSGYELELIKQISRLPEIVEDISLNFAVNRLTAYARDVADAFHVFYENCKVLSDERDLRNARLGLVGATKTVFFNTLSLIRISEKM